MILQAKKGFIRSKFKDLLTVNCFKIDKLDVVPSQIIEDDQCLYFDKYKKKKEYLCFTQVYGDLFKVQSDVSLAHCVSADMKMNKGIASIFKKTFLHIDELLKYKPQIGKCYYLNDRKRKIFYLITKQNYYDKPNYSILEESLRHLKRLCHHLDIQKLAMPKIGCGLDQLKWEIVERIIDEVFDQSSVSLTVNFRHSVSNLTSQSIINDRRIMNPINGRNEEEPTDYIYINIRCKKITEPSRCIVDAFINEYPVETLIDTGAKPLFSIKLTSRTI